MTLDCSVLNQLRKQMFHQDYIDLSSLIIIYIIERFYNFDIILLHPKLQTCFIYIFICVCAVLFLQIYICIHLSRSIYLQNRKFGRALHESVNPQFNSEYLQKWSTVSGYVCCMCEEGQGVNLSPLGFTDKNSNALQFSY